MADVRAIIYTIRACDLRVIDFTATPIAHGEAGKACVCGIVTRPRQEVHASVIKMNPRMVMHPADAAGLRVVVGNKCIAAANGSLLPSGRERLVPCRQVWRAKPAAISFRSQLSLSLLWSRPTMALRAVRRTQLRRSSHETCR